MVGTRGMSCGRSNMCKKTWFQRLFPVVVALTLSVIPIIPTCAQDTISGSSTTLGQTGTNTTSTSFSTAMNTAVTMPSSGNVLILATFSAKTATGANERTGE